MADPSKRRSVRQAVSRKRSVYVDPDTDDDFEANLDVEPPAEGPRPSSSKRRKTKPRPKPTTRSRAKRRRPLVLGQPRKANTKEIPVTKKEFSGPSDYRVPPWTSLPLNILRDIFVFASQPLHEETAESRYVYLFQLSLVLSRSSDGNICFHHTLSSSDLTESTEATLHGC